MQCCNTQQFGGRRNRSVQQPPTITAKKFVGARSHEPDAEREADTSAAQSNVEDVAGLKVKAAQNERKAAWRKEVLEKGREAALSAVFPQSGKKPKTKKKSERYTKTEVNNTRFVASTSCPSLLT